MLPTLIDTQKYNRKCRFTSTKPLSECAMNFDFWYNPLLPTVGGHENVTKKGRIGIGRT
jgi:hypothetical protein